MLSALVSSPLRVLQPLQSQPQLLSELAQLLSPVTGVCCESDESEDCDVSHEEERQPAAQRPRLSSHTNLAHDAPDLFLAVGVILEQLHLRSAVAQQALPHISSVALLSYSTPTAVPCMVFHE